MDQFQSLSNTAVETQKHLTTKILTAVKDRRSYLNF